MSATCPSSPLDTTPAPVLPANRLERLIGKPSREWDVDDLVAVFVGERLRLVNLMHVGGDGWLKTLDFVPRDRVHLREILTSGERADGSSLFGMLGVAVTASDVVVRPRPSSAFLDPFASAPALAVLCDHVGRDGRPLPESPDTIVACAQARLRAEAGIELQALGEVEYFLGKRPEESDIYGATERGYHASSPFVFGETLRRQALLHLADMGVPVKYGHSEVGYIQPDEGDNRIWEQHEVELALQALPQAADAVVLTQWVLRNLAHRAGLRCSFDPVLRQGHAGSGMHFHFAPVAAGGPLPVGLDDGRLGEEASWVVSGLATLAAALMAFGNRTANSFVRLSQAREAPNRVTWGRFNRKALIRLPIVARAADGGTVAAETVEFRLPDGSAHPHLLLAAIAQATVLGRSLAGPARASLLERTSATGPSPDALGVPRSFADVADALVASRGVLEAGGVFPPHVMDRLIDSLTRMA
jgi:glutamine synthetase